MLKGVASKASKEQRKVSDMLESETRKMEEKLELVKRMMELEKDKRSSASGSSKDGQIWRGATTKKNIKGYSDAVLDHHKNRGPVKPGSHRPASNSNQ